MEQKTASTSDVISIIRKHIDFKKAIINFTEREIQTLEKEIEYMKEKDMELLPGETSETLSELAGIGTKH